MLCAAPHVGDQPFAVLLGDDLIDPRDPLLARMIEVQEQHGGSVIALMEVDPAQIHLYGCAAVEPTDDDDVVRVTGLVEKPDAGRGAQSTYAIIGRYVLDPAVFERTARDRARPRRRDPAHRRPAAARRTDETVGGPVHGVVFTRPPLRHRRPRRLSACDCPTRVRT